MVREKFGVQLSSQKKVKALSAPATFCLLTTEAGLVCAARPFCIV